MAPKDPINTEREQDNWGIGQQADGSIKMMTIEEARLAAITRDAEEKAYGDLVMPGEDVEAEEESE
jgi:hypothetical protein